MVSRLGGLARGHLVLAAAEAYRTAMRTFADQPFLDVWYAHLDIEPALSEFRSQVKAKGFKAAQAQLAKAHTRDSTQALAKLTTLVDGQRRIISDPPMIVAIEEVFADVQADAIYEQIRSVLGKYRRSLQSDRRHMLEQFVLVQVARKLVGVGSVGTRAWTGRLPAAAASLVVGAAGTSGGIRPGLRVCSSFGAYRPYAGRQGPVSVSGLVDCQS